MSTFRAAYSHGSQVCLSAYGLEKRSFDNDRLIAALGAVSPAAASVGAGMTSPDGYSLGSAARTGASAYGGRLAGETSGEFAGRLLAGLLKQNPELFAEIGGRAGKHLGGALGADVGNTWAKQHAMQDMYRQRMG